MIIEIKGLSKRFRKKTVLKGVDAQLESGFYGLLGPNGAGKTTLLRCMADVYMDYQGEVRFDGKRLRDDRRLLNQIGYLPQKFDLFRELTLHEMMQYFASLKRIAHQEQEKEIGRVLALVNLSGEKQTRCGALSGGMVRRAGIAQALLGDPPVLIVDEPTVGLDPEERIRFKNVLASLREGKVILLSTHIVEDVESLCDRIIIMDNGVFLCNTSAQEVCALAQGKVYEVGEEQLHSLRRYEVVRTVSHAQGNTSYRILTNERPDAAPLSPTVEDGYLSAIKGI